MSIALRSFAKINLGLKIGPPRADGFHSLLTIYQTIALHDIVRVEVEPGKGIEIRCSDPRVPCDATNTCYKIAERVLRLVEEGSPRGLKSARHHKKGDSNGTPEGVLHPNRRVIIEIEKHLPVQGGMGAASSNAIAAMLGLERALGVELAQSEKLRVAAEVGSDLPLFLIGGTVLGVDRGQEVYELQDLPVTALVVVTPAVGISTPKAFVQWDALVAEGAFRNELMEGVLPQGLKPRSSEALDGAAEAAPFPRTIDSALTTNEHAVTMEERDQAANAWLSERLLSQGFVAKGPTSGVPAAGGDRAETPLLDLVRTGIENDFERVVFPEYPELREVKSVLQREGARYGSLSGSGSTLYGMFDSAGEAEAAAERMRASGHAVVATRTVGRAEYWEQLVIGNW